MTCTHWYELGQPESGAILGTCKYCGHSRSWPDRRAELGFTSTVIFAPPDPYADVMAKLHYQRPEGGISW